MATKDIRETNMLRRNAAEIFAKNISRRDIGQYSRVSNVRFSFSPTKELAAITEAAIIGTSKKNRGIILFIIRSTAARFKSAFCISWGSCDSSAFRSVDSKGAKVMVTIKTEGRMTVITNGTTSKTANKRLFAVMLRISFFINAFFFWLVSFFF